MKRRLLLLLFSFSSTLAIAQTTDKISYFKPEYELKKEELLKLL